MNSFPKYKLGLALSGGGARGFAHLGVIKAMYEYGIRPDIISGTSAGAIIGAMIASGKDPEECLNFFLHKKVFHLARFSLSKMGLMNMGGLENGLRQFLNIHTFEELQTPLFITASDLNNSKSVHFNKGELLPCILASCAIPVVFNPVNINGITYIDGGVFMNLPVRPIRELCEKVIAVEINSIDSNQKVCNMIHMAERSFHLGLSANTRIDTQMADVLISPENMTQYSMFDLNRVHDLFNEGYHTAREALKDFSMELEMPLTRAN